jgi:hypothetical protein
MARKQPAVPRPVREYEAVLHEFSEKVLWTAGHIGVERTKNDFLVLAPVPRNPV